MMNAAAADSPPPADPRAGEIVAFWLDAGPRRWFTKDAAFDAVFRERCGELHFAAARRELDGWCAQPRSAIALVLLLDQFPRNAFRGTAHMVATDPLARWAADRMIAAGFDLAIEPALRPFCYLPFMHSEALADQQRSLALNAPLGPSVMHYAHDHHDIVRRFGRFPHRNRALGRETTAEEQAFLDGGGFAG
jgi:uncharacterized protein (DUF924 family)